jgi:hypothetical protein
MLMIIEGANERHRLPRTLDIHYEVERVEQDSWR